MKEAPRSPHEAHAVALRRQGLTYPEIGLRCGGITDERARQLVARCDPELAARTARNKAVNADGKKVPSTTSKRPHRKRPQFIPYPLAGRGARR